jgi:formate hydrogenlyase subunit 4
MIPVPDALITVFGNPEYFYAALRIVLYILLAPVAGGLLSGIDRRFTAWMQGRVGPPLLQPFFDIFKLLKKEYVLVNLYQNMYLFLFLIFVMLSGSLFFAGADLLLVIFALTLAGVFFAFAGFAVNSPYCHIGAEREIIQMMSYDPMLIALAIGMYVVTGSFNVADIYSFGREGHRVIYFLPLVFAGYVYVLTIKFRKSPFDISLSHHAHQELVKGLATEFSGKYLAIIEIAHWYENVLLLGIVYLFFSFNAVAGIAAVLIVWVTEMFIDNSYARVKWQLMFKSSWLVTLAAGITNFVILFFLTGKK